MNKKERECRRQGLNKIQLSKEIHFKKVHPVLRKIQSWFRIPLSSNFPNPITRTIVSDVSLLSK
jgi:hypothetical protein